MKYSRAAFRASLLTLAQQLVDVWGAEHPIARFMGYRFLAYSRARRCDPELFDCINMARYEGMLCAAVIIEDIDKLEGART